MPRVMRVEKQIWDCEGFAIRILHLDKRDVRGDREGLPSWPYQVAAKNSWTVATWISERFTRTYPGFMAEVVDADGTPVHGGIQLGTVRDSYLDE